MTTTKILLLDFTYEEYMLLKKKFDVELKETNWKSGDTESLIPPKDCKIVFYNIPKKYSRSVVHSGDAEKFISIVEEGGAIICFIGNCEKFQLTNIIGSIPSLSIHEYKKPEKIIATQVRPINYIFSRYGNYISVANKLFSIASINIGKTIALNIEDEIFGNLEILALSEDAMPVAGIIYKGKGFYLLLPWFGIGNVEVLELIINEILPELAPHLVYDEEYKWLDKDEYYYPNLFKAIKKKEEEAKKYKQIIIKLNEKINTIKEKEQEPFNKLLKSQNDELKQAVIDALNYLGWKKVIDVDEYWKVKDEKKDKEEDIWLFDKNSQQIKEKLKKEMVYLVEVKSSKGGATDDDCGTLQKYKARRIQEFNNTNMKAILVGNYFCKNEAKLRKNPFSKRQIRDAERDGNGLLTTYELFKAIKAEKENKIKKEQIRHQIMGKPGLIEFNY